MQNLSAFMDSFDYVHAQPAPDWIAAVPPHLLASAAASGRDYVAYLADAREVTDPAAGESIAGAVTIHLPPGVYDLLLYSPVAGQSSPAMEIHGGENSIVNLPSFQHDIVIRATRRATE